jgi:uncharacterized protein
MLPATVGLSFKPEHFDEAMVSSVGFFEIHAENYMGAGGVPHSMLSELSTSFPLSLHGVALSIGGEQPLCQTHLGRLKSLLARHKFASFSEHLAWSTHDDIYFNDLLPLPYTPETLARVCRHVNETQQFLGVQMLLENPSSYMSFTESTLYEADFMATIAENTGCGLLLDVNNVFVSAHNIGISSQDYLARYPLELVREIHLAGHAPDGDVLIDAHDRPVVDGVWALYSKVLKRTGRVATLIEWDNDVPSFDVLQGEAQKAGGFLDAI